MPERAWYREMLAEPDPRRRLRLLAATSRTVKERAAGLLEVIRGAATADADIAALWARIGTEFHGIHQPLVEGLAAEGALRPGLDAEAACDVLWTLNHPAVWQLLVVERGWSAGAIRAVARRRRLLGDARRAAPRAGRCRLAEDGAQRGGAPFGAAARSRDPLLVEGVADRLEGHALTAQLSDPLGHHAPASMRGARGGPRGPGRPW